MALHWIHSLSAVPMFLFTEEHPELDTGLQLWPHQCRAEGQDRFPDLLAVLCLMKTTIGLFGIGGTLFNLAWPRPAVES